MRRRESGPMQDVFRMLLVLPWWAGVATAVFFWIVGTAVTSGTAKNSMMRPMQMLIAGVFTLSAILCLIAAATSAVRSASRRRLLGGQTGLDSLRALAWRDFEHLVGEAYRQQGYDVEETGGGGADGGVDLVLRGNGETVLVQCKQWRDRQVGVDKVRELFGVLTAERADRGILITSGSFTNDAHSFKVGKPLLLVDGPALAQLVDDVQKTHATTVSQAKDGPPASEAACPRCGSPMVLRTAKRGANTGSSFYGCTRYPSCKGTRPSS